MNDSPTIHIPTLTSTELVLPKELEGLLDLAHNLWWSWAPDARRLFSSIDSWSWSHYQSPVATLQAMDERQWEPLLADESFVAAASSVLRRFNAYLDGASNSWFARTYPDHTGKPIAYASTEYGLYQALPIYSGGLGF